MSEDGAPDRGSLGAMMAPLKENVAKLNEYVSQLEKERQSSPLANDIFEAAWYWRDLGQWVLDKNTKVNYPARAAEERKLLEQLRGMTSSHTVDEQ